MSADIVAQLRSGRVVPLHMQNAIADEIERLRAALTRIRDLATGPGALDSRYAEIARQALEGEAK